MLYTSGYTADALTNGGRLESGVLLWSKPYRRTEFALKLQEALGGVPPVHVGTR